MSTPIKREDIRKGDRVRFTGEFTADDDGLPMANGLNTYELIERPVTLPTVPGTVIRWVDSAYLPQIAQLDAGHMSLGWRCDINDDPRWYTAEKLAAEICGAKFEVLRPVAEVAAEVIEAIREQAECGISERYEDLSIVAAKFGVTR